MSSLWIHCQMALFFALPSFESCFLLPWFPDFLCLLDEIIDNHWGKNVHLLENDALGVGGTTEGGETESSSEGLLLVVLVSPTVLTASGAELASGLETSWFSFTCRRKKKRKGGWDE